MIASPSIRAVIAAAVSERGQRAELARRSGVSPQRICDYLAARRDVTTEVADRMLAALGLRISAHEKRPAGHP